MSTNAPAAKHEAGILTFPPVVHIVWGAALIIGNLVGNMLQVQSTEAWFLHGKGELKLDWGIWSQWPLFLHGQLSQPMTVAFIAAWGAQFILMTSKIGTTFIQVRTLQKHGTDAHKVERVVKEAAIRIGVWNFLAWGVILFDSMTDWGYSDGMGIMQQCFFIAVVFLMTFFFGNWGIMNLVSGIGRMKD